MNPKVKALVEALIEKSKQKATIWNSTNSESKYKLLLPNNSYLTIESFYDNYNQETCLLQIYNEKGSVIVSAESSEENGILLEELYKQARSLYHKVDETMDGFLEALKTPGVIGEEEPEESEASEEDDDLPF